MGIYYINGQFVEEDAAFLPISDLAIIRGYGVFDFFRTYGGKPFHINDHLRRLQNSAQLIGLACPWNLQELSDIVFQTLERNDYPESNVRLLITGGDSEDGISPGENPRLLVLVTLAKRFPDQWYQDGVKIITSKLHRYIPGAKSIDYIRAIMTLRDGQEVGAVESLYLDGEDNVLEGTTSNIFTVLDKRLATPAEDILPGITRDVVLEICKSDFAIELRSITRQELLGADEVFLASSNKEILPVRQVDDQLIGNGEPGAVTKQVMKLFKTYTDHY
jgi:branched-chain amino acid aminotransferase